MDVESLNEVQLKAIIEEVLEGRMQAGKGDKAEKETDAGRIWRPDASEYIESPSRTEQTKRAAAAKSRERPEVPAADPESRQLVDIARIDIREQYLVEHPVNRKAFAEMKLSAPCRLGIGKAGARCKTLPFLQFKAAHSAAQDAVFSEADTEILDSLGLFTVQTECATKDIFLTRPDMGRRLNREGLALLREKCRKGPQVQVYASDGLSPAAVNANLSEVLPSIEQGLCSYGVEMGTPFFVRFGRVGAMDQISELTQAQVTCVLIGERPGLLTAESMSAYIVYKGYVGIPESSRTVVSNIHGKGTIPAEAGAHIADVIYRILEAGVSGTGLKL